MRITPGEDLIPRVLCGVHREVRAAWRPIVKKVIRSKDWDTALQGVGWIPIDQTPGELIFQGPSLLIQGQNTLLYPIVRDLCDTVIRLDRPIRYPLMRDLVLQGAERMWFCLGLLAEGPSLPVDPAYAADRIEVYRTLLRKLLRWWHYYCRFNHRFSEGESVRWNWPRWGITIFSLCSDIGISSEDLNELKSQDMYAAGELLARWL